MLVTSVVVFYSCGSAPSKNEIELKDKTGEVIEQQANTNVAVREVEADREAVKSAAPKVKAAKEVANKAVKAAEEKRNDNSGNVTYGQANSARCKAYRGDQECQ